MYSIAGQRKVFESTRNLTEDERVGVLSRVFTKESRIDYFLYLAENDRLRDVMNIREVISGMLSEEGERSYRLVCHIRTVVMIIMCITVKDELATIREMSRMFYDKLDDNRPQIAFDMLFTDYDTKKMVEAINNCTESRTKGLLVCAYILDCRKFELLIRDYLQRTRPETLFDMICVGNDGYYTQWQTEAELLVIQICGRDLKDYNTLGLSCDACDRIRYLIRANNEV